MPKSYTRKRQKNNLYSPPLTRDIARCLGFECSSHTMGNQMELRPQSIESELRYAAREYFQRDDGMQVDLAKRTVYLNRMIKWYSADFGQEKEILKWITGYLDASKAGLLTHLLSDGGPVNVAYPSFDWSLNA